MKWDACSFCPKDALSVFSRPKDKDTAWSEETAILFIWEKRGKDIVGFEVMSNMKKRLTESPGRNQRITVPAVKFKSCPA